MVLLGVASVLVVPIALKFVPGAFGTVLAVLGALVAVACYLLSGSRAQAHGIDIGIFERGIACTQGRASRELLWNEIVEVMARPISSPQGRQSTAIIFEVVGEEPLLIVVGAPFSDAEHTRQLVDHLESAWLRVWARRARALLEADQTVALGIARLSPDGALVGETLLPWQEIRGTSESDGSPRLDTSQGSLAIEPPGGNVPFPSAARRLAALAHDGPPRKFLPSR